MVTAAFGELARAEEHAAAIGEAIVTLVIVGSRSPM
jgi:hypothetical protein